MSDLKQYEYNENEMIVRTSTVAIDAVVSSGKKSDRIYSVMHVGITNTGKAMVKNGDDWIYLDNVKVQMINLFDERLRGGEQL